MEIDAAIVGAWYDPARSGQGLLVDIYPDSGTLYSAWFTFAERSGDKSFGHGDQRWLSLQGPYAANQAQTTIYQTSDGRFDDPRPTTTVAVGTATLRLAACDRLELVFDLDQGPAGEIAMQPLLPEGRCPLSGEQP